MTRFVDCRLTFGDDARYRVEREAIESIVPIEPEHLRPNTIYVPRSSYGAFVAADFAIDVTP